MIFIKVISLRHAVGAVVKLLAERHAYAHLHSSVYLPFDEIAVYALADVVHRKIAPDLYEPRQLVRRDLREVYAEGGRVALGRVLAAYIYRAARLPHDIAHHLA